MQYQRRNWIPEDDANVSPAQDSLPCETPTAEPVLASSTIDELCRLLARVVVRLSNEVPVIMAEGGAA